MKRTYVITTAAVLITGAVAFGTIPMWKGSNSTNQEESVNQEEPANQEESANQEEPAKQQKTEISVTEKPLAPLPTTAPVKGLFHADSYEELYKKVKQWKENPSYSEIQPRMTVIEEAADAAGATSTDMDASYDTVDYSTTNTQEALVDEADIVKTDGSCIYSMDSKGTLRIVDASSMKILAEIRGEISADYREMYVEGDCLQVIRQQEDYVTYKGEIKLPSSAEENGKTETAADKSGSTAADGVRTSYSIPVTTVTVDTYDISDKEHPKKTGSYQQDGRYLSSRRNGGRLYLFTSYVPDTGEGVDQLQYYIPRSGEEYISCDHIYLPTPDEDFSYNGKVFLVTGAVSPEQPDRASDIMAVASNADIFYVSADNIYSATETWNASETRTEIIRIGYESGKFTDGAVGSVKGELNNNFSMDEYDGKLRIVTTVGGWDADYINYLRDNSLYVLDDTLHVIGKIENLAENEQIKSARFMGETGYFVTYRNTDPLFAVDLSDPENPKVLSELKITGFSEYLHFYGENRLLGIGWETDPDTGNVSGMKCSMFDLSEPSEVREMDRFILKNVSFCDALYNYRAILAAPQKNLFGFGYGIYGSTDDRYDYSENFYYGLFSYDEEKGFEPQMYLNLDNNELFNGDMSYQDYRKVRGVYIGNRFYLVTEKGIASYDMQKNYEADKTLKWED